MRWFCVTQNYPAKMVLNPIDIAEWLGCLTGVIGSLLLAAKHRKAAWAFVLYFISSCSWILYGVMAGAPGLITMQIVFIGTALLGIYTWLIVPRIAGRNANTATAEGSPLSQPARHRSLSSESGAGESHRLKAGAFAE